MRVVGERQVLDALPEPAPAAPTTPISTTSSTSSPTTTDELVSRLAWRQGVLGALTLAIRILSARAILLFAVLGAIGLAWLALSSSDHVRLAALALYTITVVGPLVWLSGKT